MSQLQISEEELENILANYNKIPIKELIPNSEEGESLVKSVADEWRNLHLSLISFFCDRPEILSHIPDECSESTDLAKQWFISLYNLILHSWNKYLKDFHPIGSPGKLAAELLRLEYVAQLIPAFSYFVEINPRRNYELAAKIAKASNDKNKLDNLLKKTKRDLGDFCIPTALLISVLSHCRHASKTDKLVAKYLKKYDLAAEDISKMGYKKFGYAKAKRQTWKDGRFVT